MNNSLAQSRGSQIAAVLAGSWRDHPPPLKISGGQLAEITSALLATGTAPLCWRRLLHSKTEARAALELKAAYYFHTIRAAYHEYEVEQVFRLLRAAGLEPVLMKGWAVARLYPESGLRPYGDVDLFIRPRERRKAAAVLASNEGVKLNVDIEHEEFACVSDRAADDLCARSKLVTLGETHVRILGDEDHLRMLCLHTLRHHAWRPLWLCDIGVVVESLPEGFDWEICLGANKREANWVACLVELASQVLGVQPRGDFVSRASSKLPRWVGPALLRDWGRWHGPGPAELAATAFVKNVKSPSRMIGEIISRWDRPIKATVEMRGPFNQFLRLPFQISYALSQTPRIARQVARGFCKGRTAEEQ
ncbi:MAG TPA: nucleotidyltransferase family protein [Blastocatellia bacterium]|nr:nucleotidyltransferase family protein [Blastocatellia bacterium]